MSNTSDGIGALSHRVRVNLISAVREDSTESPLLSLQGYLSPHPFQTVEHEPDSGPRSCVLSSVRLDMSTLFGSFPLTSCFCANHDSSVYQDNYITYQLSDYSVSGIALSWIN